MHTFVSAQVADVAEARLSLTDFLCHCELRYINSVPYNSHFLFFNTGLHVLLRQVVAWGDEGVDVPQLKSDIIIAHSHRDVSPMLARHKRHALSAFVEIIAN